MKKTFKERFIGGYKKTKGLSWVLIIIAGMKKDDREKILEAQDTLLASQDNISNWQELLNDVN